MPKAIRRAIEDGADLIFVWGGDGMVQRSIGAIVEGGYAVPIAVLPAGTANLAGNLEIPADIAGAVELGLRGVRQPLDVGVVNGEQSGVELQLFREQLAGLRRGSRARRPLPSIEEQPGKEGLVHISELADFRVRRTEDVVKEGDSIWVKCVGVDERTGKVRLSRKIAMKERELAAQQAPAAPAPAAAPVAEEPAAPVQQ